MQSQKVLYYHYHHNWTLKKLILFAHHHHHRLHPTDQQWSYSFIQKYTTSFYSLHPLHLSYHTHPSFPPLLSTNSLFFIWSFFFSVYLWFFCNYAPHFPKTWPSFLIIFYHFNWLSSLFHKTHKLSCSILFYPHKPIFPTFNPFLLSLSTPQHLYTTSTTIFFTYFYPSTKLFSSRHFTLLYKNRSTFYKWVSWLFRHQFFFFKTKKKLFLKLFVFLSHFKGD